MAQTVIQKAKELIRQFGHDEAVRYFQEKVDYLNAENDDSFDMLCKISGMETAIDFIRRDQDKNKL